MDNSYSHLAKHMSQGDVLQDMTAGKPAFPVKPLDKAVVAHMGVARLTVEWVVLSGKFDVETGPVFHVPGHERTRETLVAGSFLVIPKGQPHKVHCLEPGVVFVSYEGNPDITPIAEHDA